MISTPDAVLQAVIKRALIDSGCPTHIVNELMENAHERRWPTGLSTLETRQLNRRQYENYITKRIPGKWFKLLEIITTFFLFLAFFSVCFVVYWIMCLLCNNCLKIYKMIL